MATGSQVDVRKHMKITNFFLTIAEWERHIELTRQFLNSIKTFEPYAAYLRLNRATGKPITLKNIKKFLSENEFECRERGLKAVVRMFDTRMSDTLDFEDFVKMILTKDNPDLRFNAVNNPTYEVHHGQKLSDQLEYTLSRFFSKAAEFLERIMLDKEVQTVIADEELFEYIKNRNTSKLDFISLKGFFEGSQIRLRNEEIGSILRTIDVNNDGIIDEDEFDYFLNLFKGLDSNDQLLSVLRVKSIDQPESVENLGVEKIDLNYHSQEADVKNQKTLKKKHSANKDQPKEPDAPVAGCLGAGGGPTASSRLKYISRRNNNSVEALQPQVSGVRQVSMFISTSPSGDSKDEEIKMEFSKMTSHMSGLAQSVKIDQMDVKSPSEGRKEMIDMIINEESSRKCKQSSAKVNKSNACLDKEEEIKISLVAMETKSEGSEVKITLNTPIRMENSNASSVKKTKRSKGGQMLMNSKQSNKLNRKESEQNVFEITETEQENKENCKGSSNYYMNKKRQVMEQEQDEGQHQSLTRQDGGSKFSPLTLIHTSGYKHSQKTSPVSSCLKESHRGGIKTHRSRNHQKDKPNEITCEELSKVLHHQEKSDEEADIDADNPSSVASSPVRNIVCLVKSRSATSNRARYCSPSPELSLRYSQRKKSGRIEQNSITAPSKTEEFVTIEGAEETQLSVDAVEIVENLDESIYKIVDVSREPLKEETCRKVLNKGNQENVPPYVDLETNETFRRRPMTAYERSKLRQQMKKHLAQGFSKKAGLQSIPAMAQRKEPSLSPAESKKGQESVRETSGVEMIPTEPTERKPTKRNHQAMQQTDPEAQPADSVEYSSRELRRRYEAVKYDEELINNIDIDKTSPATSRQKPNPENDEEIIFSGITGNSADEGTYSEYSTSSFNKLSINKAEELEAFTGYRNFLLHQQPKRLDFDKSFEIMRQTPSNNNNSNNNLAQNHNTQPHPVEKEDSLKQDSGSKEAPEDEERSKDILNNRKSTKAQITDLNSMTTEHMNNNNKGPLNLSRASSMDRNNFETFKTFNDSKNVSLNYSRNQSVCQKNFLDAKKMSFGKSSDPLIPNTNYHTKKSTKAANNNPPLFPQASKTITVMSSTYNSKINRSGSKNNQSLQRLNRAFLQTHSSQRRYLSQAGFSTYNSSNRTTNYQIPLSRDLQLIKKKFVNAFLNIIDTEKQVEFARQELALRPDYNLMDNFRFIDCEDSGGFTTSEFNQFLKAIKAPSSRIPSAVCKLFGEFDAHGEGYLDFDQFSDMFLPKRKEYRILLSCRAQKSLSTSRFGLFEIFEKETLERISDVVECLLKRMRIYNQLRGLKNFSKDDLEKAFKLVDADGDGSLSLCDLDLFLEGRDIDSKNDLELLFGKLDQNMDGQVSLRDFFQCFIQ